MAVTGGGVFHFIVLENQRYCFMDISHSQLAVAEKLKDV
jgi:hypothetical protein